MTQQESVTQADREAAAAVCQWIYPGMPEAGQALSARADDAHFLVQAFAKHRRLATVSTTLGEGEVLALADKAVAWALDALGGYSCEECDAGIHYAQARGFDRWSMKAQMDHPECFGCDGSRLEPDGTPCAVCQPDPAQFPDRDAIRMEAIAQCAKIATDWQGWWAEDHKRFDDQFWEAGAAVAEQIAKDIAALSPLNKLGDS